MVLPCSGSGIIHLKLVSSLKSSRLERARGWRRRALEKKRMSATMRRSAYGKDNTSLGS